MGLLEGFKGEFMMKPKVTMDEISILDAVKLLNDREADAYTVSILSLVEDMAGKKFSSKKLSRLLKSMENRGFISSRIKVDKSRKKKRIYKVLKTVPL
jgi:DNA-binding PadR family transcriptional regulator